MVPNPSVDPVNTLVLPSSVSATFNLNPLFAPVNGTLNIFLGLASTDDYIGAVPTYALGVTNGFIYGEVGGYLTLSYNTNYSSPTFIVFQWVPIAPFVNVGLLDISVSITYRYLPALPVGGYWLTTIDPVTGLEIPLIRFLP